MADSLADAHRNGDRLSAERDGYKREQSIAQEAYETLIVEKDSRITALEETIVDLRRAIESSKEKR